MDKPLVSIIIPNFNRENLIAETLESFIDQNYRNWECIVVDDRSTDSSVEIIEGFCKKDSRFKLLIRPKELTKGANTCRNMGFEAAKGEFINWFDSDDVALPGFLSERLAVFEKNQQLDLVICSSAITDENLNFIENWELTEGNPDLFRDYALWKERVLTPSVLFKKEFLEGKELFDPKIVRGQEADFFYRILYKLPEEQYRTVNTPLFYYRQHSGTKTAADTCYNALYTQSRVRIFLKMLNLSFKNNDRFTLNHFYNRLVHQFQQSVKNNDFTTSKSIFLRINKVLISQRSNILWKFNFKILPGSFWILIKDRLAK